jgi:serine O-acetyltransferase
MLFKGLVTLCFGSDWALKERCLRTRSPRLRAMLIRLWGALQYEAGSSVAWNAQFASQPCFPHGNKSIFISGAARIGSNAVIFQQVTIGSNTIPGSKGQGAPTIGNNCYIGAGAKIIGGVRIGHNVRIAANAVVYQDVPDDSVVLSGEQRMISGRPGMDNRFYSFRGRWCYFDAGRWLVVTDPALLAQLVQGGTDGLRSVVDTDAEPPDDR